MLSKVRISLLVLCCFALFTIPASVFAQGVIEIELWVNESDLSQCVTESIEEGFNATSTTIHVSVLAQPNVDDAVRTAMAGGAGPDVVPGGGPSFIQEYAKAGLLAPLDTYAETFGWGDTFVPWALELGRVDGVLYSLPDSLETIVMWYNKTLFEQNGWEVPTTIDELVTLAQAVQDAGIIPFANAYGEYPPGNELPVGVFLNHYAGPEVVYEALTGQRQWTDPVFVEAITLLNDMMQDGWFDGGTDLFFTDSFDTIYSMLGAGEAAMMIDGSWATFDDYFGGAAGNENDYDWFPIPSSSGEATFLTGIGASWGINANSANPEAAAEFLTWMYSPAAQTDRFLRCNFALAPIQISAESFADADPRTARIYSAYGEAATAGNYGYATYTFWPPSTLLYLYEQIQRVYLGQLTPEAYLQGMQETFDADVTAGNLPPLPAR